MKPGQNPACAVFAGENGEVCDLPASCAAVDDGHVRPAPQSDFIPLPPGSSLLKLPGRSPMAFAGLQARRIEQIDGLTVDAVAAALPLGYTRTLLPAYVERTGAPPLPLFGYAAVAWDGRQLCVGALQTDAAAAWDASTHDAERLKHGMRARLKEYPRSRLIRQLVRCAGEYNCYTAQNVFLRQGEAAIPVSPACNASCIGCISQQEPNLGFRSAQERIAKAAALEEIVELAVAHLSEVKDGIVSFGQGCEGEPLLAAPRIARAARLIRARTAHGTIHCNTNASRPQALREILEAGVTSIRVSLNSARSHKYDAYYRPKGYDFNDVLESLKVAGDCGACVSLNLLTHPGMTDDQEEMDAFAALLRAHRVAMVQTRSLNVDPHVYFKAVGRPRGKPLGMRRWLRWLRHDFPSLSVGNFTRVVARTS